MPNKTERSLRSRSPGRKRTKSTSKSRSRSRSRGRSRSPGRAAKSKASPSPSQKKSTPKRSKTPTTPSTPTRQSRRLIALSEKKVEQEEIKQEVSKKVIESKASKPVEKPQGKYYQYDGPLITFVMMFVMPAVVIYFILACNKKKCDIRELPTLSRDWTTYLDLQAAGIFLGFVSFQWLLSLVPVGPVVDGHRLNGRVAVLVNLLVFTAMVYTGCPVGIVYKKFLSMAVTSIIFSLALAIFLYITSLKIPKKQLNPLGSTGCPSHDFAVGRVISPDVGCFNVKWCMFRTAMMGLWMVNMSMTVHAYLQQKEKVPYALYMVVAMQMLYMLVTLWNEEGLKNTLYMKHEGMGFLLAVAMFTMTPFLCTLQARYLVEHKVTWSYPELVGFATLFTAGFIILEGSMSQKNRFRKNAYDPVFVNMETIPTPGGNRLLASGWWGIVRHPNYLGDVIMTFAWTLPCGFGSVMPYIQPLMVLFFLAERCRQDEHFCREKHGAGWERYSQRVKYRMIPYVY